MGLLRSKWGRRPEQLKCTLIASAFSSHTNSSHSTPHLCASALMCMCACLRVCLWPLEISMLCALPSLCQDYLRQLIWDCETKTGATISIFTKKTPKVNSHMCQSADWFTVESTEVGAGSITVISRAVGSSLMRFHAMTETAEGQCYTALQQGVPQQPVVPLLLYLPPHKAGRW